MERTMKPQEASGVAPASALRCCCNCRRKLDPYQLFDDNVEDIAKSLAQIMLICGINTSKSCMAKSIIKRAFVYHDRLRTTCPPQPAPGTHLNREDVLQALRLKCSMEPVEAMLAYSIIKRAFKAFYHGKPPVSISNPIVDAMAVHTQYSAWMHAAYKTARIFDNYKAAFFWAHKHYERQINIVYCALYKRMTARSDPLMVPGCPCKGCSKQEVPGHPKAGQRKMEKIKLSEGADLPEPCILCGLQVPKMDKDKVVRTRLPRPILNHEVNLPRCQECNSPFLICECNIDQLTGEQFGECGQDSYKVKWYRLEEPHLIGPLGTTRARDENSEDSTYGEAMEPPKDWDNHHCPIDCKHDSCSEASNVCQSSDSSDEASTFATCSEGEGDEDIVAKLEDYLNKLWNEEVAQKKNPNYVPRTIEPPTPRCNKCRD